MEKSKVYFCKEITPENLVKMYEALGVDLSGKKVGVKISTGEEGAKGYLQPSLIGDLVKKVNGTIIECNTAYDGQRDTTEKHMKLAEKHGYTKIAEVDILDKDGEEKLPIENGKHLKYDLVGSGIKKYDAMINLAHGKGHQMGGMGANLKNQSIGVASRNGKVYIHSAGKTDNPDILFDNFAPQKDFIESMAEAALAVADYFKKQNKPILYITVMNKISLDCDCSRVQGDPVMEDLGIVASLDPVANDQAFVDMIWASKDEGAKLLQERIDKQLGREILPYSEELGLGTREYELITLD